MSFLKVPDSEAESVGDVGLAIAKSKTDALRVEVAT